ncbi:hypothetical protein Elgi_37080 [Paenibacillus elgii]|uniref:hypothetical protein n=1 Tax=Paenibacillus elgii TaxID=189691 RepID=UPI002D7ACBE9|nr:hypothetical protein Elgi_37080 [Paenibacillus elgii]
MHTLEEVYNHYSAELDLTSEMFRDEVVEYLSEHNIIIERYSVANKVSTVELCIETNGTYNYYFTYNKSNGDYGVVRATQKAFAALNDEDKV